MMNLFNKKNFCDKRGMTYVELLVALSLLMIIIMAFTPMLLESYSTIFDAGEDRVETYDSKSDLETALSIREDDPLVIGDGGSLGLRNKFVSLSNELVIQARRVATDVNGMETLYGVGTVSLRIVSESTLSDNQDCYAALIHYANISPAEIIKGDTWSSADKKTTMVVNVSSTFKDETAGFTDSDYSVSSDLTNQLIKVQIDNVDITYSPFKITIFYYDEFEQKRSTSTTLTITPADVMFVGRTTSDSGYFTSAGANGSTLILAGRQIDDADASGTNMAIASGTKINKVRWVTTGEGNVSDTTVGNGTYIMCGIDTSGNAFIRRLWNLGSSDSDAVNYSLSKVYKEKYTAYVGDLRINKYCWEADYTGVALRGVKTKKDDVKSRSTYHEEASNYNNARAQNYMNTFSNTTKSLIQLSKSLSADTLRSLAGIGSSSTPGVIYCNWLGTQNIFSATGNEMANLFGADGRTGIHKNGVKFRYNTYASYVTNAFAGISSPVNTVSKTNPKNGASYNVTPIMFFSKNNTIAQIDRAYVAKSGNWGSQLYKLGVLYADRGEITIYGRGWYFGIGKKYYIDYDGNWKTGWIDYTAANTYQVTGCPPAILTKDSNNKGNDGDYFTTADWDYYNQHKNENYDYWSSYIQGQNGSRWDNDIYDNFNSTILAYRVYRPTVNRYKLPVEQNNRVSANDTNVINSGVAAGWNDNNWGSSSKNTNKTDTLNSAYVHSGIDDAVIHACWYCDKPAEFTQSISGYAYSSTKTLAQNQQTVMKLVWDSMASSRLEFGGARTYIGYSGISPSTNDLTDGMLSFLRLKTFSNLYGTFDKTYYDSPTVATAKCDWYKVMNDGSDAHIDDTVYGNSAADAEVELTDVFFMPDTRDYTSNIVYTGITPAAATVYGPCISSITKNSPTTSSQAKDSNYKTDGYYIYIIRSYGTDGYVIFESNPGADHSLVKNNDTVIYGSDPKTQFKSGSKYETASFTLGYASNYSLIYGSLAETQVAVFSNVGSSDTSLTYPRDFYNITTYNESEGYLFAVGYRVTGQCGAKKTSAGNTASVSDIQKIIKETYSVDATVYDVSTTAKFFSQSTESGGGMFNKVNVAIGSNQYPCTYAIDSNTVVNNSSYSNNISMYFLDLQSGRNAAFLRQWPSDASIAYTGFDDLSEAVTNTGVIEYMNPGDTTYVQLDYEFDSSVGTPLNFKFTSVALVKIDGKMTASSGTSAGQYSANDKLLLVLGASNGYVYYGTLDYGIYTKNSDGTYTISNASITSETGEIPDGYYLRVVTGSKIHLYGYKNNAVSNIRTVCVKKAEQNVYNTSGAITSTKTEYYVFASGDRANKDGGVKMLVYSAGMSEVTSTNPCPINSTKWQVRDCSSEKFDIYDIQVAGDYVYAVGADRDSTRGIVLFKELATCTGSAAWNKQTCYSTTFGTTGSSTKVVVSENNKTLPALYSMATKNT